jgi:hypothetical protein
MKRIHLAFFIGLLIVSGVFAENSDQVTVFSPCSPKENPLFSIEISYDIQNFIKSSETLYFKKEIISR